MSCPRYRPVELAGRNWYFFQDALVWIGVVDGVRSVTPDAGQDGDDRAVVELDGGVDLRVHYFDDHEPPDDAPAVLMGFELRSARIAAFVDGAVDLTAVAALVRDGDDVRVHDLGRIRDGVDDPIAFRARPYPWAAV